MKTLILILFLIISCANPQRKPIDLQKKPVVFVHGYLGSQLVKDQNGEKKIVWITACHGLGFCTDDLTLSERDGIESEDIVKRITAIPGIYTVDVYETWMNTLLNESGIQPYFFHYDWRKDSSETAARLEKYMEDISQTHGKKVSAIGHSNGGLLILSVLNKKPEVFEKVVFVGVPFRGGVGFMKDLLYGTKIGSNEKILSSCTLQSFESVYNFLSTDTGFDTKDILADASGNKIPIDMHSVEFWKKYNFGPYAQSSRCEKKDDKEFQKKLDKAKLFRKSLTPKKIKYPPTLAVIGENRPVIRRFIGKKENDHWVWDIKNPIREKGDGAVLFTSAQPPEGIPYETFITEEDHSFILNDKKTAKVVMDFVNRND